MKFLSFVSWTDVVRQLSVKKIELLSLFFTDVLSFVLLLLFRGKVGERLAVSPQI